ncbi:MAG: SurA N-terminal domain-containing protein [bacterium]|nr:MAG: SurA N-terminal domain-containing protein [bacterium]
MLDYMRKQAGSWVIRILLFGIVVVFAFWGVGSYTNRDINTILTIGDVRVPYSEYRDIYNILVDSYRQVYDNLDSATLEFLDVKGQAVRALVERYLLLEAARRLEVQVAPGEVASRIASTQAFQENGVFSPQRYQIFLDLNRMTAEAYEASVGREIVIERVSELIQASAVVTPQEIQDNLQLMTRKAVATVVTLTPNDFVRKVSPPTRDQIEEFYDENLELYRVPERFRQAIAVIDPADFRDRVTVPVEEVEDWYDGHQRDYTEPAAYRLSHILFSLPADAPAESISDVRVRAEEVAARIRNGEITFERAAREISDDRDSALKGGDLGFVEETDLTGSIRNAAADLEPGGISDPTPTARGFEIIKLIEDRDSRVIPLDEVRGTIEEQLRRDRAFEQAYDAADDLLDAVQKSGRPLADIAGERGLLTVRTPLFSRQSKLESLELPRELLEAAFSTQEEDVGDIYERDGKLYLFQTVERNDSFIPDLEEVRDRVEGGLLVRRAMDLALEKAREMVAGFEGGESVNSLASSLRKRAVTTEPFTVLDTTLDRFEDAEQIIREAFSLGKPGRAVVASGRQAHYFVVLEKFVEPTEQELDEKRATVEQALWYQRQQDLLGGYIQGLREEMEDRIKVNEDLL